MLNNPVGLFEQCFFLVFLFSGFYFLSCVQLQVPALRERPFLAAKAIQCWVTTCKICRKGHVSPHPD
ncbi:hypothetical protein XELAEV_18020318mg [Xenopus laevis]|uniref:Uncharacterized protein n=1 Tax=Xenopus laevis TaxID=8355 RepID=A0A974D966_XENLA|nr:hypothetical protein XELAEV_18020318mg [Xenopus laevis]